MALELFTKSSSLLHWLFVLILLFQVVIKFLVFVFRLLHSNFMKFHKEKLFFTITEI